MATDKNTVNIIFFENISLPPIKVEKQIILTHENFFLNKQAR
tara:strand:+ start:709 stop:834 length:126 start_codon:yes stop_codon:yes gene_type:complete